MGGEPDGRVLAPGARGGNPRQGRFRAVGDGELPELVAGAPLAGEPLLIQIVVGQVHGEEHLSMALDAGCGRPDHHTRRCLEGA